MNIVMIGSGNVAAVLGRKMVLAGHSIVQVFGRNATIASELAYEWNTESTNYISLINKNADLYIIAVKDDAIPSIAADLQLPGKIVVHTAAAVDKDVLSHITEHYGVFYPLQSLRKEQKDLPAISIYIDASNTYTKDKLDELAKSLSGVTVHSAGKDKREKLHVAAVFVNNFTNYLFMQAEEYCKREGIPFNELIPLINNTIGRLSQGLSPAQLQTGPAIRHDNATIARHLDLLKDYPDQKVIYKFMTEQIMR